MRAWLYERLATTTSLVPNFGADEAEVRTRILPRRASGTVNIDTPYLIFGLGNATNEDLAEASDHEAERQFFSVWVHDTGPTFGLIDETIPKIKARLIGASDKTSKVTTIKYLETSGEFNNETYGTVFRYIRFQAIISRTGAVTP